MNDAKADYEAAIVEWEAREAIAKEHKEPFNVPKPERKLHYLTHVTGEAILRQVERCPDTGLLLLTDEMAGYLRSANAYRGGRGSDTQDLLVYYDGAGGVTLRVDGLKTDIDIFNYGVLGAIQPRVLERFLGDCEDEDGSWARFFFVIQPTVASTLPDEGTGINLTELLYGIYKRMHQFEPKVYSLERKAFKFLQQCYATLEQQRVKHPSPAMRAAIGKTHARIGKVALNLHLLEAATVGTSPNLQIREETVWKASLIAKLAIDQIAALYGETETDGLSAELTRVIEYSRNQPEPIKARDACQAISPKHRPKAETMRSWFTQLEQMGYGEITGEGKGISFKAFPNL